MAVSDWITESRDAIREDGLNGVSESAYAFAIGAAGRVGRYRGGTNIFDQEWDVCLVLDACRLDLMQQVAPEYRWLGDVGTIDSVASCSHEWMDKTFTDETVLEETSYVTANPHSDEHVDESRFADVAEVWRTGWNAERGTIMPDQVTQRALEAAESLPGRLLVHYMQPHYPFVGGQHDWGHRINADLVGGVDDGSSDPWALLRHREVSLGDVWRDYRSTLETALDSVETLLAALPNETDVVVTSDHGNAIGECGVYGHPKGIPIAAVRQVPWVRADPSRVDQPRSVSTEGASSSETVGEKLKALGYL